MVEYKMQIVKPAWSQDEKDYIKSWKIDIDEYGSYILINAHPFGNCQNLSIGYFNKFVSAFKDKDLCQKLIDLKDIHRFFDKPIAVVDVKRNIYEIIKDKLPIREAFPYTSSNGSNMVMVFINFTRADLKAFKEK